MNKVISTEKKPIKMWLDNIEDGALEQAKNLANLPFVFKHIAIMPDAHQGFGMPIGGVMATKNIIVPNAVGVDIGCFTEDTKVKLADNRELSFKELIDEDKKGKTNYCYSLDKDSNIIIEKIKKPRKTREVSKLIEITLDNNEKIKCTSDHKFYLRNNKEIEAKNLNINDSLMPLYIKKAKEIKFDKLSYQNKKNKLSEYNVVYNPNSHKYDFCHFLADEYNREHKIYSKKGIRHHSDFDKYNNSPDNIEICKWKEHWKIHFSHISELNKKGITGWKKTWKNNYKKFSKQSSIKMKKLHTDLKFRERRNKRASEQFKKYNQSEEFYLMTRNAGKRGSEYIKKFNVSKRKCPICNKILKNPSQEYWHQIKEHPFETKYKFSPNAIALKNHKIKSIKTIYKKTNVYCLTINKYHNFALASGVFVHNCGMCAVKTSLKGIDTETLKKIMSEIRKVIPVGFKKHEEEQNGLFMPYIKNEEYAYMSTGGQLDLKPSEKLFICNKEWNNSLKSLGTLGGGNHFIEIQKGNDGHIWIMIHSGSRNLGLQVAEHYNKLAYVLNKKWHANTYLPKNPKDSLAFLPVDSEEGQSYLREMQYCVEFALANRKLMMTRTQQIFIEQILQTGNPIYFDDMINIAHNYASQENHFGENVWVHRKGATQAKEGQIGIIPGNQGSKSYIVEGLGNLESFKSCSHGAGRVMGRKQAIRELNLEEEIKILDDQNIIHDIRNQNDLDEAVSCYKNIVEVIENQKDLVKILVELKPLAVIKG